jgi:hypothetical protein
VRKDKALSVHYNNSPTINMSEELGYLSAARYGKDLVRVFRVVREGDKHHVAEYTVKGERAFWMSC